jgi:CO dehydrogenase/acetyl-CoA synthase delta subunit
MGALPQVKYSGRIREIRLGKTGCEVTVGGETAYNFYSFEGMMPHAPKLALQVLDIAPEEWAVGALEPYKDVIGDPVAWAKKCVAEYGADLVCLWLAGTDPNGQNLPAEHAARIARQVAEAIDVPLIVWGVSSDEKNTEVLKAVAEECAGFNLTLGPVTEGNYKQVGAAAIAYKHTVAANTPIDINLAKQLNILLENLGVPNDRILIDPTTGSVGYGMEYCYSIMERIRQAALTQNDDKLQYPIINNIAEEVWKTKEAKLREEDDPRLGNAGIRAVNLEAITALSALQAGSDILILRHPDTLHHIRRYLSDIMTETGLDAMEVDLTLAPQAEESPAPAVSASAPKPAPEDAKSAAPPSTAVVEDAVPASEGAALPVEQVEQGLAVDTEETAEIRAIPQRKPPSMSAKQQELDVALTEEDLEVLRDMAEMVRAAKTLLSGLARLISGGSR